MNISDLTGLGEPLGKLIEAIRAAVGVWYRPHSIRREADAEADAEVSRARGQAIAQLEKQRLLSTGQHLLDLSTSSGISEDEFRALIRSGLGEQSEHIVVSMQSLIEPQLWYIKNKATIADRALYEIIDRWASKEFQSGEVPGRQWLSRFFEYSKDVEDEHLRDVWAKILAGEFENPGTFTLAALNTLHIIGQREAELFGNFARFVWRHATTGMYHYIYTTETNELLRNEKKLPPAERQELGSIGLVAGEIFFGIHRGITHEFTYLGRPYIFESDGSTRDSKLFTFRLSSVGGQLFKLCEPREPDGDYLSTLQQSLVGKYIHMRPL